MNPKGELRDVLVRLCLLFFDEEVDATIAYLVDDLMQPSAPKRRLGSSADSVWEATEYLDEDICQFWWGHI
jgi:hypothetical protein